MLHALIRLIAWCLGLRFASRGWRIACYLMLGVAGGMGLFTMHVSRATSYLSDDPETCMNCHVMGPQYITWQHSSHASVATCNDCHVPHEPFWAHWGFKAKDGLWHATVFTLRWEPQAIRLSKGAESVVEQNCRRCHAGLVDNTHLAAREPGDARCWDCHRETPHGRVRSLSATPGEFQPRLGPIGPGDRELEIGGRKARPKREDAQKH